MTTRSAADDSNKKLPSLHKNKNKGTSTKSLMRMGYSFSLPAQLPEMIKAKERIKKMRDHRRKVDIFFFKADH